MAVIFANDISNGFSWIKIDEFRLQFQWSSYGSNKQYSTATNGEEHALSSLVLWAGIYMWPEAWIDTTMTLPCSRKSQVLEGANRNAFLFVHNVTFEVYGVVNAWNDMTPYDKLS